MANREAIARTRAALVAAPDRMFCMLSPRNPHYCGTAGCFIGWVVGANEGSVIGEDLVTSASRILEISASKARKIFMGDGDGSPILLSSITRADAIAMCDLLAAVGEDATWREVIATRPHSLDKPAPVRALPASITEALTAREGPLRSDEPSDDELTAAMEAQS